ncbi:unnamed protein product [Paramecium sonneborni]|uniref:MIR domain-containing protein n=1 Tax=Paramecium sonneborni TaxID=65129 RepID=A0A8S1PE03_9CILI|nr:unnamed protein product [Paramecium sonneborni]
MLQESQIKLAQQKQFLHLELVQFLHKNQQIYLTDTNIENKYGLQLGAQTNQTPNTVFILEKYTPQFSYFKTPNYFNTPIIQGDLIKIKSFCSNQYVTSVPNEKSPITKQGLMVLAKQNDVKYQGGEQVFVIQNIEENSPYKRIVNTETFLALHSHSSRLKNLNHYHEVTAYKDRDLNDAWTIDIISQEMRELIKQQIIQEPVARRCQDIRSSDTLFIRNSFTGGTLHSHSSKYKSGSKQQEVTWKKMPRDLNDWWVMYKIKGVQQSSDQQIQLIENHSIISLLHVQTKQFLTHSSGCKVKAGDYFEVCCNKQATEEFRIEMINVDEELNNLKSETPFRICHVPTQLYLAALERPSSGSSTQGEIVLTVKNNGNTIWMIEQVDSIYA